MNTKTDKAIQDIAFLINIRFNFWSGRITDAAVTQEVAEGYGTHKDVGTYRKALIHRDDLRQLRMHYHRVRNIWRTYTMPWDEASYRICPASQYMTLMEQLDAEIQAFDKALADFIADWPRIKARGMKRLQGSGSGNGKTLAHDYEYPAQAELENKFGIDVTLAPVPSVQTDWRINLTEGQRQRIEDSIKRSINRKVSDAVDSLLGRLMEDVTHWQKTLEKNERIHASVLNNLKDTVRICRTLNLTGDQRISDACDMIDSRLCGVQFDALRDEQPRKDAAREVRKVVKDMSVWM